MGQREHQRAVEEYVVAAEAFPGEEGRVRYARLLDAMSRLDDAVEVMQQVLQRTRIASAYYRCSNHHWISEAKRYRRKVPTSR